MNYPKPTSAKDKTQRAMATLRLMKDMRQTIEDSSDLEISENFDFGTFDDTYYDMLATLPKYAQEELRHG